jgi:hypothetical protein
MSIQVGIDSIDGLEEARARLGDSGQIQRRMADVLNQAARIGAQSARIYAPKRTSDLAQHIREDDVQFTIGASIEARFGVSRVYPRGVGGRFKAGSQIYPLFVHEGTGLFGRLHRVITPKRAKVMVFMGRTGLVKARFVRGQKPQPYMREAYADARAYIEAHLDDMVRGLIE